MNNLIQYQLDRHSSDAQPASVVDFDAHKLRKKLKSLERNVLLHSRPDLAPYVHWKGSMSAPMHRWFRYREAYSPELIDKLSLGHRILDPFSGCGSILVGSALRGKKSLGIDINPVAAFATKVKLSRLSPRQLNEVRRFQRDLYKFSKRISVWPIPALNIATKVFEPDILECLGKFRFAIEQRSNGDKKLRDFLLLAWISVLEQVGSYFKEGNGIKYRNKKRSAGRYESRADGEWQRTRFGENKYEFVTRVLNLQLEMMLEDTQMWTSGRWADQEVVNGNAFDLQKISRRRQFDSVVFSPPYANRFDYFEAFKVELWFGEFIQSYDELSLLRKASMRSHLGADLHRPTHEFEPLEELISLMDTDASSWRMGVPQLLRGYFHDLKNVLAQCRSVLPKGRCFVVVGNSAFAGVVIPTDVLTAHVAKTVGFKVVSIAETRHLTVAPQQRTKLQGFEPYMRESIVVLE